jgi:putative oxidoreductase
MKIATTIVRVLLGLMFVVFGSNIFFHFIPMPAQKPSLATDFSNALMKSNYMYVVGLLQVAGGLLILIGRYVPLGLLLLGPVIVNILLFHIFLDPSGLPMAIVVSVFALFLLWRYRANFAGVLQPK